MHMTARGGLMEAVEDTDRALVERAAVGEEYAFRMLYRRHVAAVYRVAAILLGEPADAEDATQESFVTAWGKLRDLRLQGESALPWLATICRYQCANRLRARRRIRENTTELGDQVPHTASVEEQVIGAELATRLAREVEGLSSTDRDIFALCIGEGYTYEAAAAELGLTQAAVRNRLSRIRSRLRTNLREETD